VKIAIADLGHLITLTDPDPKNDRVCDKAGASYCYDAVHKICASVAKIDAVDPLVRGLTAIFSQNRTGMAFAIESGNKHSSESSKYWATRWSVLGSSCRREGWWNRRGFPDGQRFFIQRAGYFPANGVEI